MDTIIQYFSNIPPAHRSAILIGGIALFWLIESIIPLYRMKYDKWKHAGVNIFFTITTILVNFPLVILLLKTSQYTQDHHIGILQWLPTMPAWLYMIIGLLLLDLIGAYSIHWLQHKVKWMWQFHVIHHTDTNIDTTSANRHHPGESVFRLLFTILATFIAGAPIWMVFLYQAMSVALSQFNHANINLPAWLNKAIGIFFVTPDMHHIHHHYQQPYTDTNYGNIFPYWDRIFGTYANLDREKVVYGIDTYMKPEENSRIVPLLKIPFGEYRKSIDN